jgi:c(7)-type cytochrome triheme protein
VTGLPPRLARRMAPRLLPAGAAVMLAAAALLVACSLPQRVKSVVFEPAPPPKQVVHAPRRAPYQPPPPPPKTAPLELKPRTDWPAELAKLPQLDTAATDWVRALDEKLIDPKPGLDDKAEEEPVLDLNVELIPKDMPDFKATYPHKIHTQLLACASCHTGIFQMQAGADPITMEKILAGEYCGRCHGKVAFDPATACPRCHLGMPK